MQISGIDVGTPVVPNGVLALVSTLREKSHSGNGRDVTLRLSQQEKATLEEMAGLRLLKDALAFELKKLDGNREFTVQEADQGLTLRFT